MSGIPRILHQIWVGSQPPEWVLNNWAITDEALQGTGFEARRWLDPSKKEWPVSSSMREHVSAVVLSDFMRLELLYRFGGIYMDSDAIVLHPGRLLELTGERKPWVCSMADLNSEDRYASGEFQHLLGNHFLGAPQHCRQIDDLLRKGMQNVRRTFKDPTFVIGPPVLRRYWEANKDQFDLLPYDVFPTLVTRERSGRVVIEDLKERFTSSAGVHVSASVWRKDPSSFQTTSFVHREEVSR